MPDTLILRHRNPHWTLRDFVGYAIFFLPLPAFFILGIINARVPSLIVKPIWLLGALILHAMIDGIVHGFVEPDTDCPTERLIANPRRPKLWRYEWWMLLLTYVPVVVGVAVLLDCAWAIRNVEYVQNVFVLPGVIGWVLTYIISLLSTAIATRHNPIRISEEGLRDGNSGFLPWDRAHHYSQDGGGGLLLFHELRPSLPFIGVPPSEPTAIEDVLTHLNRHAVPRDDRVAPAVLALRWVVIGTFAALVLCSLLLYVNGLIGPLMTVFGSLVVSYVVTIGEDVIRGYGTIPRAPYRWENKGDRFEQRGFPVIVNVSDRPADAISRPANDDDLTRDERTAT